MGTIDYEIRLAGDIPDEALTHLRDAHLTEQGVETVLRGPIPDQAALIGIINWLQMMGIDLREVRQTGPDEPTDSTPTDTPRPPTRWRVNRCRPWRSASPAPSAP